ncbi:uncharacterized protein [Rutidosis leptorrhynchoides]|uniref:uncharacterized protein n=1 Tax=Rutidosis leptorrhynchoides TaxID=125765 RepID=UPI003A98E141
MTGNNTWPPHDQSPSSDFLHHSGKNVYSLLARREVSPRMKCMPKKKSGEGSKCTNCSSSRSKPELVRDVKHYLISWAEAESLRHLSAKYCPLVPPPRSTIAAAFSSNGRTLASTHGDHTVKIIDCQTGKCLKVLSGHRRTPWVVRFHPLQPEILASGSLDQEVRLWNANTSECLGSRDFYRPIASIAFHAEGELLAVASGHKLYIWNYDAKGEASTPAIILKTRRSLRAVHFHPHGAPFLLTAEVNDLESSDSSMTRATSPGDLRYPPPAIFVANAQSMDHNSVPAEVPLISLPFLFVPSFPVDESRVDMQYTNRHTSSSGMQVVPPVAMRSQRDSSTNEQHDSTMYPMDTLRDGHPPAREDTVNISFPSEIEVAVSHSTIDAMDTDEMQPAGATQQGNSTNLDNSPGPLSGIPGHIALRLDLTDLGQLQQFFPARDRTRWELPFLQGWLMGQGQANIPAMHPHNADGHERAARNLGSSSISNHPATTMEPEMASHSNFSQSGASGFRHHILRSRFMASNSTASVNPSLEVADSQPIISRIQAELASSLAAAAAAELPCTVKLRVWKHDIKNPYAPLSKCRLVIPHAVLCSEMGAHFSPCGRYLAACVACVLPQVEADPGTQTPLHQEPAAATSPTRHPISGHQIMYELRIYSLEKASFGSVLVSRAIRAAHCLTSIQFSPTSEHILLAYGRRHGSLLKSIVIDGEMTSPIYTVLEVYRVADMELVRVLPSAEDEVNVACFHPSAGGGLVYGTKEGKLRVLQFEGVSQGANYMGPNLFPGGSMTEVQTYALEG